ncbi:mechanosensitive ion channel family protein [Anaeroselena agilis]|uniref:Mechanosensitive ion channel family protein n=1 Tax=Anaeroselena agilis TaxID=3063788 RepID=A0ABU3P2R2_9FIRM|nr:mechanosensitive ion channel family protein [Selenomonadales bacterium 4137-cl]
MESIFKSGLMYVFGYKGARIIAIVVVAVLLGRLSGLVVDRLFHPPEGAKKFLEEKRARTLSALLKTIIRYTLYFLAAILILQEFSIDTTSIIAGAGVVGLALGVGAQGLVKDFITGFFIIFEDQFAVGDYIVSDTMAGTVEELTFRVTKLRDASGVLHIIPNGVISRVSNYTRGQMQAVINIPVAYEADIDKVIALLGEAAGEIARMPEVQEGPKIIGVVDLRPGEVIVRVVAKTVPLEQVKVETAFRHKTKILFEQAGIPAPGLLLPGRQGGKA